MSLLAHPERNIFLTGRAQSALSDVAKVLGVRLGRRNCDIQVETRKRKLLALSAMFRAHSDDSGLYGEVLMECANRRNLIAYLDYDNLANVPGYQNILRRFYVVVLLDEPEADAPAEDPAGKESGLNQLPCDLQLNWRGFPVRQLARIITHCLYG